MSEAVRTVHAGGGGGGDGARGLGLARHPWTTSGSLLRGMTLESGSRMGAMKPLRTGVHPQSKAAHMPVLELLCSEV